MIERYDAITAIIVGDAGCDDDDLSDSELRVGFALEAGRVKWSF
jgi:hypothetical protein